MKRFLFLALISVVLISCNVSPQPIVYGEDACHYCNMTIVDRQHASQLVTAKGKTYSYDAIECLIQSSHDEFKETKIAFFLVTDYNEPGVLTDATKASFLVSDEISSPMGANLSAFTDETSGKKAKETFTGALYSWENIQSFLKQ